MSFVWIQLVFRFLLIIAEVVFALATSLQYALSSLDLIAKLLLDICIGQLWLEVYYLNGDLCRDEISSRLRYIHKVALRYIKIHQPGRGPLRKYNVVVQVLI